VLAHVKITGFDAAAASAHASRRPHDALTRNRYDCILIDAPCSSDRHVLADPSEMCQWTVARVKQCAERQFAILTTAISALKHNGRLVYATCALSRHENDDVVEAALRQWNDHPQRRHHDRMTAVTIPQLPIGCATRRGWIVLPDDRHVKGYGPLYFSVLTKEPLPTAAQDENDEDKDDDDDDHNRQLDADSARDT